MDEPFCGPSLARVAGNVVIFPWIRWREPTLNILPQLVTCQTISVFSVRNEKNELTFRSVYITRDLLHEF